MAEPNPLMPNPINAISAMPKLDDDTWPGKPRQYRKSRHFDTSHVQPALAYHLTSIPHYFV